LPSPPRHPGKAADMTFDPLRHRRRNGRIVPRFETCEARVLLSISVANTRVTEIASGTNALFVVSLSAANTGTVTVDYVTSDGTAVAGVDYTTTQGTVTFKPGQTAQVVSVPVLDDKLFNTNTVFFLNLIDPIGDTIATAQGTATIVNSNQPPQVTVANFSQTDTTAGTVNATANVTLSAASALPVAVSFSTADITAHAGTDYTSTWGTVTIPAGATSAAISIPILGSTVYKGTRTFALNILSASNATVGTSQAIGTINDVNLPVGLSIASATASQGSTATSTALFNVNLAAPSGQTVTVNYATADPTTATATNPAVAGTDYVATSGTLSFAPGATSETIPVTILPTSSPSATKQFFVNLTSPMNTTVANPQAVGTIINTVPGPNLSIANVSVNTSPTATVNAIFNVNLSTASTQTVTVNYATADITAHAGTDYTETSSADPNAKLLTFTPGQTVQTITVPILPTPNPGPGGLFSVTLSGATNALLAHPQAIGTIINTSTLPFLAVGNANAQDPATGATGSAVFPVSLSSASAQPITVSYSTADGTAIAGKDYTATTGLLTFPANSTTSQNITIPLLSNPAFGPNRTFTVNLTGPTNATIATANATGTISNTNTAPTIAVGNATATPPLSGSTTAVFAVKLSAAAAVPVTVNYATSDGSAAAGVDYQAVNGTLTFPPGQTSQNVSVPILGQSSFKSNLTFNLNLSGASNGVIATGQGVGTIVSGVTEPAVSINNATVIKNAAGTSPAMFTVTLSAPSGETVTVPYSTADGTAVAGVDYQSASGTLTFPPGVITQTITVPVLGNPLFENSRTFDVNLGTPTNAKLGQAQGIGTIGNVVAAPALSIGDATVQGALLSATSAVFNVSLSAPSNDPTTVAYATADGTAVAGKNYQATSGTLTFAPGVTQQTITVPILANLALHGDQTFTVNLSAPNNATIAQAQGTGTILANNSLVVTSTADNGPGSLRLAIEQADSTPGPNTIAFDIPGNGPFTIFLRSALPPLMQPTTIDATTQPGYSDTPLVELNGAGAGLNVNGLTLAAGNSAVKGLTIDQFTGSGVFIEGNGGDVVQSNYIGTDLTGTMLRGNTIYGVLIDNSPNNLVGGPLPGEGNVISGNSLGGVYLGFADATGNQVVGNYIGTSANGSAPLPNGLNGVFVDNAPNNQIGTLGAGNVISGNQGNGVQVFGKGSSANRVVANLIGINAAKTAALPNGGVAVFVNHAGRPKNVVGGPTLAYKNVVAVVKGRHPHLVVHTRSISETKKK
jgi:large repetitive protein